MQTNDSYKIKIITSNHVVVYKVLVLHENTWKHATICKLFLLHRNTWYLVNGYVNMINTTQSNLSTWTLNHLRENNPRWCWYIIKMKWKHNKITSQKKTNIKIQCRWFFNCWHAVKINQSFYLTDHPSTFLPSTSPNLEFLS